MTKHKTIVAVAIVAACGFVGLERVSAKEADKTSKTASPTTKPAEAKELTAEVIEVKGLVERSIVPDGKAVVEWTAVKKGEKLSAGTQIRTGLRAHLVLRFGDSSVVMIKRSTLASIDQFYRDADTETVRLGLGYGAVRGGTSEGTVHSDFVVDSTVATLAKRGTEGWEFWVEPYTGRFRVSLAESGLVEALEKLTGQRRLVYPSEYADYANIGAMWIKQDIFDRTVHFFAAESISGTDLAFNARNPNGISVIGPGLGTEARGCAGRSQTPRQPAYDTTQDRRWLDTLVFKPSFAIRPEGDFGFAPTFDVLVPETQRKAFNRAGRHNSRMRSQINRRVNAIRGR